MRKANINNDDYETIPEDKRPQVVLIKRASHGHKRGGKRRHSTEENPNESMMSEMEVVPPADAEESYDCPDSDSFDDEFIDAREGSYSICLLFNCLYSRLANGRAIKSGVLQLLREYTNTFKHSYFLLLHCG